MEFTSLLQKDEDKILLNTHSVCSCHNLTQPRASWQKRRFLLQSIHFIFKRSTFFSCHNTWSNSSAFPSNKDLIKLLHPELMSARCADFSHKVFIASEEEFFWATVPAICTNFKLTQTTSYLLGERPAPCVNLSSVPTAWQRDLEFVQSGYWMISGSKAFRDL